MKRTIFLMLAFTIAALSFNACEEVNTYDVKVLNECYMDVLNTGLPFLKVRIDEVQFNGETVVTNLEAPEGEGSSYRVSSQYFQVESGTDYEVKVKFTTIFYDAENLEWEEDGVQEEYVAGTESWSSTEEHTSFALKFTCGGLLNAYRPEFETFYVD